MMRLVSLALGRSGRGMRCAPSTPRRRFGDGAVGLTLFDSLSERVVPLAVRGDDDDGRESAWYTCGPTTYAPAHVGHARTYVCVDVLRRVLEANGSRPLFVVNVTDADDKIMNAAAAAGEDPVRLARRYEREFWSDLDRLNCLRPHVVTRVTECVESAIVPYIEVLVDKGLAYSSDDGVYFHTAEFQERLGHVTKYGKLAPPAASEDFFSTGNLTSDEDSKKKKDPRDFVLWKFRKPGESLSWPSPWGDGRPGWHIECSAMIESVRREFRDTHRFAVHAGGVDLKFPHHTNEIAQAEAFRSAGDWIPHWVHAGHLRIDGRKMSKSLKNFVSIKEFLGDDAKSSGPLESPADDFRLWCLGLSGSYRGPATFSEERIREARNIRMKIVQFLIDAEAFKDKSAEHPKRWRQEDHDLFNISNGSRTNAMSALNDDLNGSKFLECVMDIVEKGSANLREPHGCTEPVQIAGGTIRDLLRLVGFSRTTCDAGLAMSGAGQSFHHVVGGEKALLDEFASFRNAIRKVSLDCIREKADPSDSIESIVEICDRVRDVSLPAIGVRISDRASHDEPSEWKYRAVPPPVAERARSDSRSVPLRDPLRVGKHRGAFSEFDEDGLPTKNADGTDVSKRLRKKLAKKRSDHKKRLES